MAMRAYMAASLAGVDNPSPRGYNRKRIQRLHSRSLIMTQLAQPQGLPYEDFSIGDNVESVGQTITEADEGRRAPLPRGPHPQLHPAI